MLLRRDVSCPPTPLFFLFLVNVLPRGGGEAKPADVESTVYPSELTMPVLARYESMTDEEKTSLISALGRVRKIEDMAGGFLWLASKAGEWLNGNVVVTDGGRLSVVPATY